MGIRIEKVQLSNKKRPAALKTPIWKKEISLNRSGIGNKMKESYFTELGILLGSGIRLKEALRLIGESQKKEKEAEKYYEMAESVLNGKTFSQVIADSKYFNFYDVQSLKIGEQTGTLEKVTASLGDFYAKKNQLRRTIIGALTYPAIVMGTAIVAVVFMLRFVVPMFQDVFHQNNIELPSITKVVIGISDWISSYGIFGLLFLLLLFMFSRVYGDNETFKRWRDMLILKTPILGNFLRLVQIARFTQAFSLLVSAKISIQDSIDLSQNMIDFTPLKEALKKVKSDILQGNMLSDSLKKHTIFDAKMVALVRVAEETNQTEDIFKRLNEQYIQEVNTKSKQFSTLLEPFIILGVGLTVGFILIAMYLPMFELGNVLN